MSPLPTPRFDSAEPAIVIASSKRVVIMGRHFCICGWTWLYKTIPAAPHLNCTHLGPMWLEKELGPLPPDEAIQFDCTEMIEVTS